MDLGPRSPSPRGGAGERTDGRAGKEGHRSGVWCGLTSLHYISHTCPSGYQLSDRWAERRKSLRYSGQGMLAQIFWNGFSVDVTQSHDTIRCCWLKTRQFSDHLLRRCFLLTRKVGTEGCPPSMPQNHTGCWWTRTPWALGQICHESVGYIPAPPASPVMSWQPDT